jgi:starvation-inducible DNA-binding protein
VSILYALRRSIEVGEVPVSIHASKGKQVSSLKRIGFGGILREVAGFMDCTHGSMLRCIITCIRKSCKKPVQAPIMICEIYHMCAPTGCRQEGDPMSKELTDQLNALIADFTVFYQKLRHYHWNVKGEQFFRLHEKFEEIYTEAGDVIDELAERVVGLEGVPLHTLAHMLEATSIKEDGQLPAPNTMVSRTVGDVETLNKSLMSSIETAEGLDDRTTVNLLDEVRDGLEAHLWMLKAWQAK